MKTITCQSGVRGWHEKLRSQYSSRDEWLQYSTTYGLHTRLGYETPEEAWKDNPTIEGSVNPSDFRKAHTTKPKNEHNTN